MVEIKIDGKLIECSNDGDVSFDKSIESINVIAAVVAVADIARVVLFPKLVMEEIFCFRDRVWSTLLHASLNAHARSGWRAKQYWH